MMNETMITITNTRYEELIGAELKIKLMREAVEHFPDYTADEVVKFIANSSAKENTENVEM